MAKKSKQLSRRDELELLLEEINDELGEDGKVYLGIDHQPIERIPTGILALDTITGGGLPRKHLTEFYGAESSGKTTLTLNAAAAVQRQGGTVGWVVGEEFNDAWAVKQGVDLDQLVKIEALTGDKNLEIASTFIERGMLDLLVIDSYQALGTVREWEAGVDKEAYAGGGSPQLWGRFYRRTRAAFNAGKSNAALIGISQVRDAIGGFAPGGAKPEPKPTQIRVLLHWKAISVLCKRGEPVFEDMKSQKRRIVSREFNLRCVKNKTAPPERVSSYVYNFRGENQGIDTLDEIIRLGKVYDVLEQRGKYLQGFGLKVAGGNGVPATEAFKDKLRKRPKLARKIRRLITEAACQ